MSVLQVLIATAGAGSAPPPNLAGVFSFDTFGSAWGSIVGVQPTYAPQTLPSGVNFYTEYYNGTGGYLTPSLGSCPAIYIDLWFYPTANNTTLISEFGQTLENSGYQYNMMEIGSDGYIRAGVWNGSSIGTIQTSTNPVVLNAWNHVYFYHDGNVTAHLEVNGAAVADVTYSRSQPSTTVLGVGAVSATIITNNAQNRYTGFLASFEVTQTFRASGWKDRATYQAVPRLSLDANNTNSYPGANAVAGYPSWGFGGTLAIFAQSDFSAGTLDSIQVGWEVTDNNGFNEIIATIGSNGAGSMTTTTANWPNGLGVTFTFTPPTTQWSDLVANPSLTPATLINGPTYAGAGPKYFSFDPASTQYALVANQGDLSYWTVESWFRVTGDLGATAATAVITTVFEGDDSTQYHWINYVIGNNNATNRLSVGFFDGAWRQCAGFVPTVGTWYHVIGTYDGTYLKEYVNGALNSNVFLGVLSQANGGAVRIARRWDQVQSSQNYFPGDISTAKIYAGAMSPGDALTAYNSTKATYGL